MDSLEAALIHMPALQSLSIRHYLGFNKLTTGTAVHRLILSELQYLSLNMPGSAFPLVCNYIAAPSLKRMFFYVNPWTRLSMVFGTLATDVTILLNSILRHVEQAAASERPIHLAMEGPFQATSDESELLLSLHTSGLVFRDTMRPPWVGRLPVLLFGAIFSEVPRDETHVLQPLWDRFELQALTIHTVSLNVALWHRLFRHQAELCALDILYHFDLRFVTRHARFFLSPESCADCLSRFIGRGLKIKMQF
jgi:hypothetical protein